MINVYKRLFLLFALVFCGLFFVFGATNVQLNLEIEGIGIRHGTPSNLDLGVISYSPQDQEITGQFNSGFWVEDLMGLITGHYTTIQCNGLNDGNGSVITGIYLQAGNASPIKVLGNTGNVLISNDLTAYKSIYNPLVYIYKPTNSANIGKANKYQDTPTLKVIVPANTTAGTYNGTIVFSLYMD
ncbi:MAG: hypothetical protein WAZ12_01965 [Candidatus Absconditicoccaceae bacterium]